jgi:hypothetical protein
VKVLARPTMTFIFVSGSGAQGNAMWARVKRKTEEALFAMPFTERVGQAMLRVAKRGFPDEGARES